MSQGIFTNIDPATTSGDDLASVLNIFKDSIASGHSGTSRPPNLQAGGTWVDITDAGSPNFLYYYKIFDGSNDITLLTINIQTNALIFSGTNDLFEVTKISADTAGAIIAAVKARILNNGQVLDGDTIGEYQFKGTNDDGDIVVTAKLIAVAIDDFTDSAAGTYLAMYATTDGGATLSEMWRLKDGNVGLGDTAPDRRVSVKGATDSVGYGAYRVSDDALGIKNKDIKARITGTGQVQTSDSISLKEYYVMDETSTLRLIAQEEIVAVENQSSTTRKVERRLSVVGSDGTTLTEMLNQSSTGNWLKILAKMSAMELVSQDIATAASITAMSATNSLVRFINSTASAVHGISATGSAKVMILVNASSAIVTLKHQSSTDGTAANRLLLPNGADVAIPVNGTAALTYDATSARWRLVSATGVSKFTRNIDQSIAASGVITISADPFETIFLQGSGGAQTANATTPLAAGLYEGQIKKLIGKSDTNLITLLHGGNLTLNGDVTLGLNDSIELYWDATGTKYIEQSRSK